MDERDTVVTRNVSIYPEQERILQQFAVESGLGSISAAIRFIISDWMRLRGKAPEGREVQKREGVAV